MKIKKLITSSTDSLRTTTLVQSNVANKIETMPVKNYVTLFLVSTK